MGRPRHAFLPCLSAVRESFVPYLASQGVVREPFHLLDDSVTRYLFQRLDNAGMQRPTSLLEYRAVRHLMCQSVLECIDAFGKETGFIQKLGGLQMCEATVQRLFGYLSDGLK
jgi:hypothetical protein